MRQKNNSNNCLYTNSPTDASEISSAIISLNSYTLSDVDLPDTNEPLLYNFPYADDSLLLSLKEIDPIQAQYLHQLCTDFNISAVQLKFLEDDDLKDLFPKNELGNRIQFRHSLREWKVKIGIMNSKPNSPECLSKIPDSTSIYRSKSKSPFQYVLSDVIGDGIFQEICSDIKNNDGIMTTHIRTIILKSIDKYFQQRKIKFGQNILEDLAKQIHDNFPTESEKAWFDKRNGQRAKGFFINFKGNHPKTSKTSDLNTIDSLSTQNITVMVPKNINEQQAKILKSNLKYNIDADINNIIKKWEETVDFRKQDLHQFKNDTNVLNILAEWPSFNQSYGYKLINIDFDYFYPEKQEIFYNKWENFENKIYKIFNVAVINKKGKELYSNLKKKTMSDETKSSKHASLLYLLHYILKPSGKKISIEDSIESFIKIIPTASDLDYNMFGEKLQPFIFCISSKQSILEAENFYVFFDKIKYVFDNFLESFSVLFKIFYVFNIKFPDASINFWTFVHMYFFEIDINTSASGSVNNLLEKLKA